jgi:hypothetical protein
VEGCIVIEISPAYPLVARPLRPGDRLDCRAHGCTARAEVQVAAMFRGEIVLVEVCRAHADAALGERSPKPPAIPWSEVELQRLREMVGAGVMPAAIADEIGRSVDAVKQMRKKLARNSRALGEVAPA